MELLPEAKAADFLEASIRTFRKLDLPYLPPQTRRKGQRLYRLDVLEAWRREHGTWRDRVAEAARRTHTKLTYRGEAYSKSPHYDRWRQMVARCTNPDHRDYPLYGGRGIQVHEPWLDDPLACFRYLDSLGDIPDGYTLDRIDNDGHYEPGNLQFVDVRTQNQNRRGWANLEDFAPCCWCRDCEHDAVTCSVEGIDWVGARDALGTGGAPAFDHRKARKDFHRMSRSTTIVLPAPRPEVPSRSDEVAAKAELGRFLRELNL